MSLSTTGALGLGLQCSGDDHFNTMIHDFPKDDATGRPGAAELYNRGIERGVQSGQPLVKGMVLVEGEGRSFKGLTIALVSAFPIRSSSHSPVRVKYYRRAVIVLLIRLRTSESRRRLKN